MKGHGSRQNLKGWLRHGGAGMTDGADPRPPKVYMV
jgi:hypothetical protein